MMFKMNRNSDPAGQVIPLLPGTETPHTDGCSVTEASGLYSIDLTMPLATTAADVNKCGVVRVKCNIVFVILILTNEIIEYVTCTYIKCILLKFYFHVKFKL